MPKEGVTTCRLNTEKTAEKNSQQLERTKKTIKGNDVKKLIKGIVEELFQKHQEK